MTGRCQRRGHASSGPTIATSEITASVAKLIPITSRRRTQQPDATAKVDRHDPHVAGAVR
jgi:hypothetical protein